MKRTFLQGQLPLRFPCVAFGIMLLAATRLNAGSARIPGLSEAMIQNNSSSFDLSYKEIEYINKHDAKVISNYIKKNPNCKTLKLSHNQISEVNILLLWVLQPNNLGTLNLSYNKIGNIGAAAIGKGINQLSELNLCDNQIGNVGAEAIRNGIKKNCCRLSKFQLGDGQDEIENQQIIDIIKSTDSSRLF